MDPLSIPSSLGLYGLPPPANGSHDMATGRGRTTSATAVFTPDLGFRVDSPVMLPPPGPEFYETRRVLWLTPRNGAPRPRSPSSSRAKLEELLSRPDAVTSETVWEAGVKSVWKGLLNGGKLRRTLPLWVVVKVLKAGWIRNGTWPDWVGDPPSSPPPPPPLHAQPSHDSTTAHDEPTTGL